MSSALNFLTEEKSPEKHLNITLELVTLIYSKIQPSRPYFATISTFGPNHRPSYYIITLHICPSKYYQASFSELFLSSCSQNSTHKVEQKGAKPSPTRRPRLPQNPPLSKRRRVLVVKQRAYTATIGTKGDPHLDSGFDDREPLQIAASPR